MTVDCAAPGPPPWNNSWQGEIPRVRGGTLFLGDLVGLTDDLKHRLFRALRDHEHADVRFLLSSSETPDQPDGRGEFRQDLYHYYRASVVCLRLPPLRDRGGDVERIAESCLARFTPECGRNVVGFTRDAIDTLKGYSWPGNVRNSKPSSGEDRAVPGGVDRPR